MELKQETAAGKSLRGLVLIVPYGIETRKLR